MQRVEKILSQILGIDEDSITDDTSPDNVESWDSFNGLLIASELERVFDVKFTMQEISETKNVGDIKRNLKQHGIKLINN